MLRAAGAIYGAGGVERRGDPPSAQRGRHLRAGGGGGGLRGVDAKGGHRVRHGEAPRGHPQGGRGARRVGESPSSVLKCPRVS
eukprot:474627-Pyramimonas_sp.AAC.2